MKGDATIKNVQQDKLQANPQEEGEIEELDSQEIMEFFEREVWRKPTPTRPKIVTFSEDLKLGPVQGILDLKDMTKTRNTADRMQPNIATHCCNCIQWGLLDS